VLSAGEIASQYNEGTFDTTGQIIHLQFGDAAQPLYDYEPYLTLSGSNYDNTASTASLQLTRFTVAIWFQTTADFSTNAFLINKGGAGSETPGFNQNYAIWLNSNENLRCGFESLTGGDYYLVSSSKYNDGKWHYAVVTYDGNNLRLFVDGLQVSSRTTGNAVPDNTGGQPVRVGANSFSPNQFFRGNVDEARIWDQALTASQISDAYNNAVFSTSGQILYKSFG
jgi:hypothetical protein